ncbi:uncharacterized protein LOC110889018 isoform X4 [Helianthus annuus]|uniref:uncharacterized protein LOC110889018 isoform X4 n=1 Tax=Helianthus annuus TaxID=4232 RepID=UPI0016531407|nr:uncharacterized protein LOC110889018 isoform X4 [Helianthus annuus]
MTTTIAKFAHLQIPLEDVVKATNNFHHDNIIGRGGLGHVYKGQLQRSGELIKISALRLDRKHGGGVVEFWTEVSMLSDLKHPNIVSIVGYCDEKDEKIVVTMYEAKNGSLKEHLNSSNLTWTQRLKICVGVARALSYLHYDEGRGYGVIHLNINNTTILLDENWEPKLSGFKVSIKQSLNRMDQVVLSEPIGTIGYMDPEIGKTKGVTCKSDIYAFGVVLFEILCGRRAYIRSDANRLLAPLVMQHYENETLPDMIHPDLKNQMSRYQISVRSLRIYSETAYSCLKEERAHRPHMLNIVSGLEKALEKALKFQPRPENFGNNLEHLKIELDDIKLATHNFSDTYKTGSSNCYTFYTVELDHFDKENPSSIEGISKSKLFKRHGAVVIKRFLPKVEDHEEELFFTELEVLASVKHHNIVTLIGFCVEGFERILVTEKFSNGFLSDYLGNVKKMHNLTWKKRLKICIDGAHALNYLHYEMDDKKMMIHNNIYPFRFGLDENCRAKIKDFEFAVFLPPNQKDETLYKRTYFKPKYHVDPEYEKTGKLKRESDVYSFGVVMFEILCGRVSWDQIYLKQSEKGLVHVARQKFSNGTAEDIIDPILKEETLKRTHSPIRGANKDSLYTFLKVANQCVAESQDQRPTMNVVLNELEQALVFQVSQEEQVHEPNKDQVVDELQIATFQIREEQTTQVIAKPEKALELGSMHGILVNNLEHLKIPLTHILSVTNDFSNTYRIKTLSDVQFYRAELEHYDKKNHSSKRQNTVIIKRYPSYIRHQYSYSGEKQFLTEIEILTGGVKHPNIVTLLGFCVEDSEMILVIDNFSNGFLGEYLENLKDKWVLTWEKRLKICIDVAHGLHYIHSQMEDQKMIINRDIYGYNIGLDENLGAKIVYFGNSVFLPPNQEDKALYLNKDRIGRTCHIDPQYEKTGKLKRESDVYGFGVVLFEILCGRLAYDPIYLKESDKGLAPVARQSFRTGTLEEMIDPIIKEETAQNTFVLNRGPNKDSLHTFISIARQCVVETQDQRPTVKVVVNELKKALFFQNMASTMNQFAHLQIPLEDVAKATNNFHHDNIIEHGGVGIAYKGRLLWSGRLMEIAARRFDCKHGDGDLEFLAEISALSDLKHKNLVSIIGFCDEINEKIIVTTYEANGSLGQYLNSLNLTWKQRLRICLGVARALSYLHYDKGRDYAILHCNINSNTILLDDNWEAKLSGFEFSIKQSVNDKDQVCPCEHTGTLGCVDPAIEKMGGVTHKSDIYSFGVFLFETLCGRKAVIQNEADRSLAQMAKYGYENGPLHDIIDLHLLNQILSPQSLLIYSKVAYSCLKEDRADRPNMHYIMAKLEKALELQLRGENIENKLGHLKIHLSDIKSATHNFSETYTIASWNDNYTLYRAELHFFDKENLSCHKGKYEGEHLKGQSTVVLKRYPSGHALYGEEEFFTEIEMLTRVKHPNIVNLLGFCVEDSEMVLVIENISNGYLVDYLGNVNHMRILTWEKRLKICIDVAHALNYLHYEMEDQKIIINRQINSYSIGLDENWGAKIVDFWFSVFLPPNQEDEALYINWRGRPGYIDSEHEKTYKLKRESDVYGFGVVLFEILCGMRANDPIYKKENVRGLGPVARQSFCMGTLEDMIDTILKDEIGENNFVLSRGPNKDSLHTFMKIAYQCVAETQDQRPTMKVVVKELEKALSLQLNSEVKSDYVEEKSHASIIETQVVELSSELNNMNMTRKSEIPEIHNKEKMLHDQSDDPAKPDC